MNEVNKLKFINIIYMRFLIIGVLLILLSSCGDDDNPVEPVSTGGPVQSVSLRFDSVYLDLDSAIVDTIVNGIGKFGTDVHVIPFNGQSVIIQTPPAGIAILTGLNFSDVSVNNTDTATFTTTKLLMVPFDSTKTVLIQTLEGSVFKLGNPIYFLTGVTFEYALMTKRP